MTSRSAIYRQKLKSSNPDLYRNYLERQREAANARREAKKSEPMTRFKEVELQEKRERQRIYQANYRARLKGEKPTRKKLPTELVRRVSVKDMTLDERRAHNARLKAESRARQSSQKKRRVRERAREYMRKKRALTRPLASSTPKVASPATQTPCQCQQQALQPEEPAAPTPDPLPGPSTLPTLKKKTVYNIKTDVKKVLRRVPPEQSAVILEGLVNSKTPEYKAAIQARGLKKSPSKKVKRTLFGSTSKKSNKSKKTLLAAGIHLLQKARRKQKDCKWSKIVKDFYLRFDVSRTLPHARYSTKHGPAHVMTMTIRGAWAMFRAEHPGAPVGYTKFSLLRPRNVRKLGSVPAETCLCMYCLNVKYKIDALNRPLQSSGEEPLPPESQILKMVCCPEGQFGQPNPQCVFGECTACQSSMRHIQRKCQGILLEETMWLKWGRGENNKLDVVSNNGTVEDLLKSFKDDIDHMTKTATFREHLFTAHWQYREAKMLKCTLEEGETMMIMDFAENRKACFGSEVKSAHFSKHQITLHPIVAYWRNQQCQLVRHVLMYLSDDIRHDHHAVHHFTMHAIEHVKKYINLRRVVLFSDGCSSQYKGKGTFADLSLIQGLEVERAYYGSEHGKGEADGETGILSQKLRRAVLGGSVNIRHANDLFLWADANLKVETMTSSRQFFLVKEGEIKRDRDESDIVTLNGTRKYHQIQRVTDYVVRCRRLACFCTACKRNRPELCINENYVGPWIIHHLKRASKQNNVEEQNAQAEDLELLNTAFIADETSVARECQQPQATSSRANPDPGPSSEYTPAVGDYVEIVFRVGRKATQKYICLIVESTVPLEVEGDFMVIYLRKAGSHYTMPDQGRSYLVNSRDDNVVSVSPLKPPIIDNRGRHFF